jgi:signal transduction histidine kinase/CHASE1-domain containing sensor protein
MGAALAVLALGLGATAIVAWRLTEAAHIRDALRFENGVLATESLIRRRVERYVTVLAAAGGLFAADEEVSRRQFQAFVERLDLPGDFPGLHGLGFVRRVVRPERISFAKNARALGVPAFSVWPSHDGPEYYPVLFLEPLHPNHQAAIGFDLFTEPAQRTAMERARDTGKPAATARVTLPLASGGDEQQRPGFLIFVPAYRGGEVPDSIQERRERLLGFVYAVFGAHELLRGVFVQGPARDLDFAVHDGVTAEPTTLLHAEQEIRLGEHQPSFSATRSLNVAGRLWTILYETRPDFERHSDRRIIPVGVLGGALVSILLFAFTRAQINAREQAESVARQLQEAQQAAEAHLAREEEARQEAEALVLLGRGMAAELDLHRLLERIVDAARRLFDAELGAYVSIGEKDGGAYVLSGAGGPAGELFPGGPDARRAALLGSALASEGVLVSEDLWRDRCVGRGVGGGDADPWHPDVRSCLAVSVVSRSGEVLGGLFFGHRQPGVFTERDARVAVGVAAQAAIAIDNARLFRRAQEAIRMRDSFLSIASHELKTPLTALQLQIDGLLRRLDPEETESLRPERLRSRLLTVNRQSRRLGALIDELLDVSRVTEGRLTLALEEVNLADLLLELKARFEPELSRSGCTLAIKGEITVRGRWDRSRLDQVLTNLLANAIKYGPGKPIEIRILRGPDEVCLFVTDQGMGVDPKDQARIFERFERAVSERQYGGFGLGLWISRQIVEALGGTIQLTSQLGQGSTFEVRLPLRGPPEAVPPAPTPFEPLPPAKPLTGRRALG